MPEQIENENFQIIIDDRKGCNILACNLKKDGKLLPLMPDTRTTDSKLSASSFIMMPYSNRIENGTFRFNNEEYELKNGENHSIHGDVRKRPWTIVSANETRIECSINSAEHSDMNWPWEFTGTATFSVDKNTFRSTLSLRNDSRSPMPAGFGWHPYFSRKLSGDTKVLLQMDADGVYPDENQNCIPSGPALPLPAELDFRRAREVSTEQQIDHCYTGYDGQGRLHWPESGVTATFSCSKEITHLVLYTPLDQDYLAFEPVSNANNGVNLRAQGDKTAGTVELEPGQELSAQMEIKVTYVNSNPA